MRRSRMERKPPVAGSISASKNSLRTMCSSAAFSRGLGWARAQVSGSRDPGESQPRNFDNHAQLVGIELCRFDGSFDRKWPFDGIKF